MNLTLLQIHLLSSSQLTLGDNIMTEAKIQFNLQ